MKINLEILDAFYLFDKESIEELNTKELVPQMVFRRRLTKAAKLVVEVVNNVNFNNGRIIYGTAYGELLATGNILNAILNPFNKVVSYAVYELKLTDTELSASSLIKCNTSPALPVNPDWPAGNNIDVVAANAAPAGTAAV